MGPNPCLSGLPETLTLAHVGDASVRASILTTVMVHVPNFIIAVVSGASTMPQNDTSNSLGPYGWCFWRSGAGCYLYHTSVSVCHDTPHKDPHEALMAEVAGSLLRVLHVPGSGTDSEYVGSLGCCSGTYVNLPYFQNHIIYHISIFW